MLIIQVRYSIDQSVIELEVGVFGGTFWVRAAAFVDSARGKLRII